MRKFPVIYLTETYHAVTIEGQGILFYILPKHIIKRFMEKCSVCVDSSFRKQSGKRNGENPLLFCNPHSLCICRFGKSSLAPEGKAIAFRLDKNNGFEWIGEYDISADELLNGEGKGQKTWKAKEFLLEILADGGMAQKKIEEEAEKLGIKKKTLRNAKMELGIDSVKRGNQWYWMLSE